MTCGPLPGQDHLAHVTWKRRARNGKVSPMAFILREDQGEKHLSTYWLEKHGASGLEENIGRVRARIASDAVPFNLEKDHRFVLLEVGDVEDALPQLEVKHDPTDADDSHTVIKGYDNSCDNVLNELALIASRQPIFLGVP